MEDRTLLSGTLVVTNNDDSGSGSLRAMIAAAASGDTIKFAGSLDGETIMLTSAELDITTSLTIDGPGSSLLTVSGGGAYRVFEAAAGLDVTISGLTITDGHALDQGGGILDDGSNLSLAGDVLSRNVAVESATSSGAGGALYSLGGDLNITDCQITGNQALGAAGPSAFGDGLGGGLDIQGGSAKLSGVTMSGNLAQGGDDSSDGLAGGGDILTQVPTSITSCTISDNQARAGDDTPNSGAYGGALDIFGSSTTIKRSTVSGNQAVGGDGGTGPYIGNAEGGAINNYGNLTISGSTFDRNQCLAGSGGNSGPGLTETYEDYSFGGAIANTETTSDITDTIFSENEAIGGNNSTAVGSDFGAVGGAEGGALYNELGSAGTIAGCTFDRNEALGGNGDSGTGSVVLVGEALGGAIVVGFGGNYYGPATLTVSDSAIFQNVALGGDNDTGNGSVSGLVGTGAGAGLANYAGGTVNINDSEVGRNLAIGGLNNSAGGTGTFLVDVGAGGGLFNFLGNYNSPGYGDLTASVITVSDCTIDQNQAQGAGGGNGEGGGIADVLDATTIVANSRIILNQADGGGGAGLGGGAYNDATSSLTLTASVVTLNRADGSPGIGGGIYTLGTFTFDASTVILFNHASTSGDNIGS